MSQEQPRRKMHPGHGQSVPASVVIPDKLYFRIGDVAQLCGLEAYVLRYWETEFPQLKPNKGGTGQRLYRKRDVELVLEIKRLLYTEGFTIAGARRLLAEKRRPEKNLASPGESSRTELSSQSESGMLEEASRAERDATARPAEQAHATALRAPAAAALLEMRQQMRELLKLLGSDEAELGLSAPPVRNKRDAKKNLSLAEEPTLFN